ncbi:laccase 7 [Coprinopsis cinerea okayama7|uniref:Laccase 11 n=1 Tax=Coprinopsis cinerea (strain Okayama-7 / 130 / ATCC MYA-4618 / FGSC 9003) TaxID=240176 RepID=Q08AB6_COPC7|nr:laccase 7 [Coprinopsis cinerea okayama7\|eukprot:XP_001829722.2 laccase 7 [Coprinopsis cinerea okayama7\
MSTRLVAYLQLAISLYQSVARGQAVLNPSDTMVISNANVSPDGVPRSAVVVNGVHPGPVLVGQKDDNFAINVVNELTDPTMLRSTSVHWHGLFQRGTNWADGAEGVNQCPIAPERSFLYRFSPAGHAGTFWYHSHFGTQYCDGLRGPMVVYDPEDPYKDEYDVDDVNTIITLADWYHTPAPSIRGAFRPDATLINGLGRTPGGPPVDLAVVNVQEGQKYRFRIVSLACDVNFQFSIDGHKLTVIEADGQLTDPLEVDRIQIFTGQRYSVILHANQAPNNYRIRAIPNAGVAGLTGTVDGGVNSAILRYAGAPVAEPTTEAPSNMIDLSESQLHAYAGGDPAAPGRPEAGGADVTIPLRFTFSGGRFFVNGTSYTSPSVPTLLQIMNGANPGELLPENSVYYLPRNQVVEVEIPSTGISGSGPHPFHLHGHAFSVVRSAGNSSYNYVNPVKRDVVSMGGDSDLVTIRFVTDNPGPWFFHCHIEPHLVGGLAIVFAEAMEDTAAAHPDIPTEWRDLCDIHHDLDPSLTSVSIVRRAEPTGLSAKFRGL